MAELKDLVINNFQKGIADSPHTGFGHMRNVNISAVPGVVKLANKAKRRDDGTGSYTGLPRWFVRRNNDYIYGVAESGQVLASQSSGDTWSVPTGGAMPSINAQGNGIFIWEGYLGVIRDTTIDFKKLSDGTNNSNWKTDLTDDYYHPAITGQDNIVYIGNGYKVAALQKTSAAPDFDPTSSSTYNWNLNALDLQSPDYHITCFAELGTRLLVGTYKGSSVATADKLDATVFPWTRTDDTFNLPIRMSEVGVWGMATQGNLVYIAAGFQGNIYVTNGSQTELFKKLPLRLKGQGEEVQFLPGAMFIQNNKLYVGVSHRTTQSVEGYGVWSIDLKTGVTVLENTISTGTATDAVVQVGALIPVNSSSYVIGWQDADDFGVDKTSTSELYTGYQGYIESPAHQVGLRLKKRTFQQMEIILDRPLSTGEAIEVDYRKNLSDEYETAVTMNYATYEDVMSINVPAKITDAELVQLRIKLTTGTASNTSPHLREIRLR